MANQILRLGAGDLWRVLDLVDPVELVTAELVEPGDGVIRQRGRMVSAPHPTFIADGMTAAQVLLEDLESGMRCLLPVPSLLELRAAVLVALAARRLIAPGVVTTAVFGSSTAAAVQLAMVARHTTGVSFVSICPWGEPDAAPVAPEVLAPLAEAGISVTVAPDADEAVFGANLLLVADPMRGKLRMGGLARGALLVNASGWDLPDQVVDAVDGIYVDDAVLLGTNRHRRFVQGHLDRSSPEPVALRHAEGWHRRRDRPGHRWVDADLRQVLTGEHAGRTHPDDILLVELLGVRDLDLGFAGRLHRAALAHGVGEWLNR